MAINLWASDFGYQIPADIEAFQVPEAAPKPEFWSDVVPSSLGYTYAPIVDYITNSLKYGNNYQVGYNPLEDMDGYESYESFLINAQSEEHMQDLKLQLDRNIERRETLANTPVLTQFAAGIFDPINLVALPFGGPSLSIGRAALKSGASVGALQVGLEAARYPFDPLATPGESATNIGTAFVTGGLIGGLLSIPGVRRANAIRKTTAEVEEYVEATQGFTAEDISAVGQRESRPLGKDTDEVLDTQRDLLPKVIEALEEDLAKLQKERASKPTNERAIELDNEIAAKTITVETEKSNLLMIRREQNIRRVENINAMDLDDAFGMASNFYTDSWLYKAVTTPIKRILQGNVPDTVKAMTVKLAGDSGVLLKLNQFGIATPKSVYQYAATRNGEWLKVYNGLLEKFGQHSKKGYTTVVDVNISNIDGSFSKFLRDTNEKYVKGERGASPAQDEALELLKGFYKTWEERLVEVGILGQMKSFQAKNIRLERQLAVLDDKIAELEMQPSLSDKQITYLEQLRTRRVRKEIDLRENEITMQVIRDEEAGALPVGEEFMFPRYWDRDAIKERRQEFASILKEHFRENPRIFERVEYEGRQIRNIAELTDAEIKARYGEEFKVIKVVTEAQDSLPVIGDHPVLGKYIRFDEDSGIVYVNRNALHEYYTSLKEKFLDPADACKKLNDADASKVSWHHVKFMLDHWDDFKTFNDFQDMVILHELHHGKFKQKYKEDTVEYEMRINDAALRRMKSEHSDIRSRRPAFVERTLPVDETSLDIRVENTINEILGETDPAGDMAAFYGSNRSKHFRHRKLDIPNALVTEFIQMDPLAVMKAYTQRVAPQYEFAKMYGGRSIEDVLDDIDDDMFAAGKSLAETNRVRKDFMHLYDRVVGTVLEDPTALSQRTATVLRDAAQLNYLGSAGFSTLPDFAKITMEHELGDVFKALFSILRDERVRMNAKEAQLAGEALEIIQGDAHMRLIDEVTNDPFSSGFYQKNVAKLKWGFYLANLLAPMTNVMKKLDATVRAHSLIQMSVRRAEGKASKFEIEYLGRYGIDVAKAKQFKELVDTGVIERSDNGLYLTNSEAWPSQYNALREEFRSSMNSGIMNTILMGTPADKPIIVDGVAYVPYRIAKRFGMKESKRYRGYSRIENGLLGLPFQFYSYTLAAVNKITASYATGQARNRAVALVTSMGLAYAGLELKNMGRPYVMDNMDFEDKLARSFDMSGAAALYSDIFYTAMHVSASLGGPDIGMGYIEPKAPIREGKLNAAMEVAGAGPSIGQDVAEGVLEFTDGNYGEGAKQIIRSMPLARLWIWRDFMNEATNALSDTLPNEDDGAFVGQRF